MTHTLMPTWTRSLAWLALPLVVAGLLVASRRAGHDWTAPADEVESVWKFTSPPDPVVAEIGRLLRVRQGVADEVRAGRLSLFEAAAVFWVLNQAQTGQGLEHLRRRYPDVSDEERHCRHVISWVEATVLDELSRDDGTVARLRGELKAALNPGPLRLPEAAQALSAWGASDAATARVRGELRGMLEGVQRRAAPFPWDSE